MSAVLVTGLRVHFSFQWLRVIGRGKEPVLADLDYKMAISTLSVFQNVRCTEQNFHVYSQIIERVSKMR